jgi:hypothetical protein
MDNHRCSVDLVSMVMKKYPAALEHWSNFYSNLPVHIECIGQSRSSIIFKCIELYPESLGRMNGRKCSPLHLLLEKETSPIDLALMMIEKFPAALNHRRNDGKLPLHLECSYQCRSSVISKLIELYPESLDIKVISIIIEKVDKSNFHTFAKILSIIFTSLPMTLYDRHKFAYIYIRNDIRADPCYRHRILNLLPRHVFTPTHHEDLNWQS